MGFVLHFFIIVLAGKGNGQLEVGDQTGRNEVLQKLPYYHSGGRYTTKGTLKINFSMYPFEGRVLNPPSK
jgi:hypothetical protein